jgi:hypothetical protein
MAHGHGHEHDEVTDARESRNAAFMGLGAALVWLLIVGGISYALVPGGEAHAEGGAATTTTQQPAH